MIFDFLSVLFSKIFFFTGLIQNKGTFPKPLSPEDEKKYLELSRAGDKEAKEILIRHNMRLVAHVAKKYSGAAETDDLLSVGSIGLIKAINTFREGKGTQLATYTARCIENEILMLLRSGKIRRAFENIFKPPRIPHFVAQVRLGGRRGSAPARGRPKTGYFALVHIAH